MNQELQNRAKSIQQMLTVHPLSGADLLMDFARQYAANKDLENKVILLKLDYNELVEAKETVVDGETANTKQQRTAEIETELTSIISQLAALADEVVQDYNPEAVQGVLQREKELAQEIQQQEIPEKVILSINSIRKTYKSTNFQLQTGDLQFHLGEVIGLVGENATGKTTLFRILAGDLKHDKGELSYPLFQTSKRLNWLALKAQIAYVPQALPKWHGTLLENLKYEAAIHGIKGEDNRKAVEYIIQRLGLAEHIEKSWQQLSGGYKLRFALAKALVWKPQLLILDEPLANLDIRTQIVVLNDLQNLAKSLR
ncbi:MAG: ATP-binding cassette domain-containing protein, partial [Bacteroidota bacterium]